MKPKSIAVIGSGIIGIKSAEVVKRAYPDARVAIVTDSTYSNSLSYAVRRPIVLPHPDTLAEAERVGEVDKVLDWLRKTVWHMNKEYEASADSGLLRGSGLICSADGIPDLRAPIWKDEMLDFAEGVEHAPTGFDYAWQVDTYSVDVGRYVEGLLHPLLGNDFKFWFKDVGRLDEFLDETREDFDLWIVAAGLGSGEIVSDEDVFPEPGKLVEFVLKDRFIKSEHGFFLKDDRHFGKEVDEVAIVKRVGMWAGREARLFLGASASENDEIIALCRQFLPNLDEGRVFNSWELQRPSRKGGIRLESEIIDGRHAVVHHYGHGPNGFTLMGSAHDLPGIIDAI